MKLSTHSVRQLPLAFSLISAGSAAEVVEDHQFLDVNDLITKGRDGFVAFEVTGDSMVDTIHPGYIVFVDTWAEPKNGDIVASVVNGLTCIKIFRRARGNLYLVPANPEYEPRRITAQDNFWVLGVVRSHLAVY